VGEKADVTDLRHQISEGWMKYSGNGRGREPREEKEITAINRKGDPAPRSALKRGTEANR